MKFQHYGSLLHREQREQETHKESARIEQLKYTEEPVTRDKISERIGTEPQGQLARKVHLSSQTTLEPPQKMKEKEDQSGTIKNGAETSIFFLKSKVLHYTHRKTKNPTYWNMPAAI